MWTILDQMQLLMLLLVSRAYIPNIIIEYILGFGFAMLSVDSEPLFEWPLIGDFINFFHEEIEDDNFDDIEVSSKSAFIVNLAML